MKMRTKMGVITASSVLALAVPSFRHLSTAGSASEMKVSLQDISGKPLSSLFNGMPVDKRYPEFKRLVAKQRPSACGRRPSQASRLLRELGLWMQPVVHACGNCGDCGFRETPPFVVCDFCGKNPYHGEIREAADDDGIRNGSLVCTTGPNCPGVVETVNCTCPT